MEESPLIILKKLTSVINRVFLGKPKGYSVIFTRDRNPYKEPDKNRGVISDVWKDVLDGRYSNNIGKDVIFETPIEAMFILRNNIGMDLPEMKIQEYVLPIPDRSLIMAYLNPANPVIVTKKQERK